MGRGPINLRIDRDDPVRINALVAVVVVAHDMRKVHRVSDAGPLVQLACVGPQVRIIHDPLSVTLEVQVVDRIEAAFVTAGFVVTRNAPFAGAYITQAYGKPSKGQHAVQVEIDRSLYMNEKLIRPNGDFETVRAALRDVIKEVALIGEGRIPLAAE